MSKAYNRVNIDGSSVSETLPAAAAINPGTFVKVDSGEFAQATAVSGRMYIAHPATHQGLGISDAIPQGASCVAEYAEEGRELALRVGPGTYTKDQPLTMSNAGVAIAIPAAQGTYKVVAYSQDELTVAGGSFDFLRVRFGRADSITVA